MFDFFKGFYLYVYGKVIFYFCIKIEEFKYNFVCVIGKCDW